MTEYERERSIPAPAEQVFALAADLRHLDSWLPGAVAVHPGEPPGLDVEVHAPDRDVQAPGVLNESRSQLRLEWGREGSPDYSGWLQVFSAEDGACSVLLHLSFHGDHPANHGGDAADRVQRELAEALDRLAGLAKDKLPAG